MDFTDHTLFSIPHTGMDSQKQTRSSVRRSRAHGRRSRECAGSTISDVDLWVTDKVGGYLESFALEGKIVGGIALGVLIGEVAPGNIPAVRGANAYIFDERALRRWGSGENDLPRGSECCSGAILLGKHK